MIFSPSRMILAEEIHHFLRTNPNDDLLENWLSCCQLFSVPSWARLRERNPCVLNMAVRHSDAENHSQICLVIRTPKKIEQLHFTTILGSPSETQVTTWWTMRAASCIILGYFLLVTSAARPWKYRSDLVHDQQENWGKYLTKFGDRAFESHGESPFPYWHI